MKFKHYKEGKTLVYIVSHFTPLGKGFVWVYFKEGGQKMVEFSFYPSPLLHLGPHLELEMRSAVDAIHLLQKLGGPITEEEW